MLQEKLKNIFTEHNFDSDKPTFPIYVPSRGRADINGYTIDQLFNEQLYTFVVVEPQDEHLYKAKYGDKVLVLPENNRGISYVRNFCKDHSKTIGAAAHFQIDDNIRGLYFIEKGKKIPCTWACTLSYMEKVFRNFTNIGGIGISHSVFAFVEPTKECSVNTQVFSCCIFASDNNIRWIDNIVEDTDYSLQLLDSKLCTLKLKRFAMKKIATKVFKGGNTDITYAGNGRHIRATALEQKYPGWFETYTDDSGVYRVKPSRIWKRYSNLIPLERNFLDIESLF